MATIRDLEARRERHEGYALPFGRDDARNLRLAQERLADAGEAFDLMTKALRDAVYWLQGIDVEEARRARQGIFGMRERLKVTWNDDAERAMDDLAEVVCHAD
jgi:hypothetical protein